LLAAVDLHTPALQWFHLSTHMTRATPLTQACKGSWGIQTEHDKYIANLFGGTNNHAVLSQQLGDPHNNRGCTASPH
jgi:hypothetical protein